MKSDLNVSVKVGKSTVVMSSNDVDDGMNALETLVGEIGDWMGLTAEHVLGMLLIVIAEKRGQSDEQKGE